MNYQLIALNTLLRKEVGRFFRIWPQTLLPSVVTMSLYFVIFGNLIGQRIGELGGYPYMQFIAPGLIMMSVITNAYANVSSSFYGARFQHSIDEMLIAPMPCWLILLGFVGGGILRGICVGVLVTLVSLFFTHIQLQHFFVTTLIVVLTATLFSLAGFLNGLFANKFDDISLIPTFVLTPLTYLGGVFYSIDLLPALWKHISLANPVLYMVNTFRYGMLGISDINVYYALLIILLCVVALFVLNLYLLKKGVGIKT
jgi:ABC-2 type transport system permease protein